MASYKELRQRYFLRAAAVIQSEQDFAAPYDECGCKTEADRQRLRDAISSLADELERRGGR